MVEVAAPDHAMWSYVIDDKGRHRAAIFYKAASYDRRADIKRVHRFTVLWSCTDANGATDYDSIQHRAYDQGDTELFATARVADPPRQKARTQESYLERDAIETAQRAECATWLDENRPGWSDPVASWDLP